MQPTIVNNSLDPLQLPVNESLFTLANGYIGIRGNFEEGYPGDYPSIQGTYINGFYDTVPMVHAEKQFGDPEQSQKLLNIMDAQGFHLYVGEDREKVTPFCGTLLDYQRQLDLEKGITLRSYTLETEKGRRLRLTYRRLVSFAVPELFLTELEIEALNFTEPAELVFTLDGDVSNHSDDSDPRVASGHTKRLNILEAKSQDEVCSITAETMASGLRCSCTAAVLTTTAAERTASATATAVTHTFRWILKDTARFTKHVIYTDSLRHGDSGPSGLSLLAKTAADSFETHLEKQKAYLKAFWEKSDIEISGGAELQDGIRFNLYHLLQAAGKDPHCSVAAKGLSGEGYEGHYFWDTEIYILPFFIMTHPELAENLLLFRCKILPDALDRARELGHQRGALFPWRTISGKECSGYFPAGTAQYHISGDIAYAFIHYYLATGNLDFMAAHGAEVVFETARLWLDAGHFTDGRYHIDGVTGPDEYTAIVNNNYYTNTMARYNLLWAVRLRNLLRQAHPDSLNSLLERIGMTDAEFEACTLAAEAMILPYSESLDIHAQDDSFLNKAPWDFSRNPSDGTPLLLHFHPLTLYRHQVCKQADVVLSHFLLEDGVPESTLRNSYEYYENITTFDSSLTACIFSIMASRLGMADKALDYFNETVRLDLDNTHLNTKDGLHMASMGGTWMALIYGFAGLRLHQGHLSLKPALPTVWGDLKFSLCYQGSVLTVFLTHSDIQLAVSGRPVPVSVNGKTFTIESGAPLILNA